MRLIKKIVPLALASIMALAYVPTAYAEETTGEKPGWKLVFQEEFEDEVLDPTKFSDSYLTHWTTVEQSLAHYDVKDGIISLRIDKEGQGPWWADAGKQKVSSIQTGMRDGLHNFWDSCTILDHHRAVNNFVTKYGYFELRARIPNDGGLHSAWWMIGTEAKPDQTGEIDIFEICGPDIKSNWSKVRVSVHPWKDKKLREQGLNYYPSCDVSEDFHTYGFEWQPDGMNFYFDGKLVRQTKQSPDYPMYTLLGIYENEAPFWSGKPDYNSDYPKRFEIDYFRAYKTDEMLAQEALERQTAEPGENLAPYAVAGASQDWNWDYPPSLMLDKDPYTAMQSTENPAFPQYLYLDWEDSKVFDTFVLKSSHAKDQAPTNWDLEVSEDGKTGWTTCASSGDVEWSKADDTIESKVLHFPKTSGKALRIKINSANLNQNHYAIHEVLVKDSTAAFSNTNLAPEATAIWNSKNPANINNGDYKLAGQSKDWTDLPADITLVWPEDVSFNEVKFHCWYAQDQAPTRVSLEVSSDGQNWQDVAGLQAFNWKHNDASIEEQVIGFDRVQGVKYLRIKVRDANLRWRHFAINEVEVFDRK